MSARLMQILASLAQRRALRGLDVICETQHQISTRKLEQYIEQVGDELAANAHHLRIEYDALTSKVATLEAENAKLRAELEMQVPDGCLIVPIQPTEEMRNRAQDYLAAEGMIVSDWLVHTVYTEMLAAAPSAPATVQGVNQQLLEAVTAAFEFVNKSGEHDSACDVFDLDDDDRHKDCNCGLDAIIRALYAAIAAARKEGKV